MERLRDFYIHPIEEYKYKGREAHNDIIRGYIKSLNTAKMF